jgi:hypothetical protein
MQTLITESDRPYWTTDEVANRYGLSLRSVHELTRLRKIPHRVLPHSTRILFEPAWLEQWQDGAELETFDLPNNGRIVRPK